MLTIRRATHTRVSTLTIHRRQIEQNLISHRPLHHLPLIPSHCRARLQRCLNQSGWNHTDWTRVVFSNESHFHLYPDYHRRRVWRRPGQRADPAFIIARHTAHRYVDGILRTVLLPFLFQNSGLIFQQDNAKPHITRVAMNCLTAYQILPLPARLLDSSPIEHVWGMIER
ncbi:transposable element Tc1 transposase [Trichonephila clavipes]|nr:transposable element Tc1 transposase [Trichonephila clavipes]